MLVRANLTNSNLTATALNWIFLEISMEITKTQKRRVGQARPGLSPIGLRARVGLATSWAYGVPPELHHRISQKLWILDYPKVYLFLYS